MESFRCASLYYSENIFPVKGSMLFLLEHEGSLPFRKLSKHCEDVRGSGGIAQLIRNLDIEWKWVVSLSRRLRCLWARRTCQPLNRTRSLTLSQSRHWQREESVLPGIKSCAITQLLYRPSLRCVNKISLWRLSSSGIPEDGILYSHRRENPKSYIKSS
jgi:hypothetical protein